MDIVQNHAIALGGAGASVSTQFIDGGKGRRAGSRAHPDGAASFRVPLLYDQQAQGEGKIDTTARRMYGAADVVYSPAADAAIETATCLRPSRPPDLHGEDADVAVPRS